jgi:hypothetical protein
MVDGGWVNRMVGIYYIGEWRLVGEGKIHRKGREELKMEDG